MNFELIIFYLFSGLVVAGALSVLIAKNPVSSALSLIVSFFAIAALYTMLGAHLLAVIQILVYAGAIMVLFTFVIMLLNLQERELLERQTSRLFKVTTVVVMGVFVLKWIPHFENKIQSFPAVDSSFGTTKAVGRLLFQNYWFPFEYLSILLLVALVGSVLLAKRDL